MKSSTIKFIIALAIAGVFITLSIIFMIQDMDVMVAKILSIPNLLTKHEEVIVAENNLTAEQNTYKSTLSTLTQEEQNYSTEKSKYEAISNETINMIKEATTQENYDIEYMWIKLGNYAKVNNLSIILTEPNGRHENSNSSSSSTTTTTTTTTTGTPNSNSQTNSSTSTLFKMQVTGSYIDVSDFVFEVENDKELRFKLDNIVMEYVSGTTIRATFNVKNMIINK